MTRRRQPPAASLGEQRERRHLEFALQFANASSERELLGMELFPAGASNWPQFDVRDGAVEEWADLRATFYATHPKLKPAKLSQLRVLRDTFVDRIARIHARLETARTEMESTVNAGLAQVRRTLFLRDGILHESLIFVETSATDGEPFLFAYELALLLDKRRPFGSELRQCALADCENYFLSKSRGGGPRPKYCCLAHTREADNLRAAKRMAAIRAQEKARRHK